MSRAVRVLVPLNSRCSRKWDAPWIRGASSRDPAVTQTPRVTDRTHGMRSVTNRMPESCSLRRITARSPRRTLSSALPAPRRTTAPAAPVPVSPIPAPPTLPPRAGGFLLAPGLQLLDRGGRFPLPDRIDADPPAALLHPADDDVDLVADVDDLLHRLHALAPTQLRDVHESIGPGKQVDEGAEGRGLHDLPSESLADLRDPGIEDLLDHLPGPLGAVALPGAQEHRAVVLDIDVRSRGSDDLVDPLAFRPDDLTDLVDRNLPGDHPRRLGRQRLPGLGKGFQHLVQDVQPGVPGLLQRTGQDLCREARHLRVELKGCDVVPRPGDLEVHVAEGVLGAEDVGQGDELSPLRDQ